MKTVLQRLKQHLQWLKQHILLAQDGSLSWLTRIALYLFFLGAAIAVVAYWGESITSFFQANHEPLRKSTYSSYFSIAILLTTFGIIFGVARFIVNSFDTKKQFEDTFNQQSEQRFERAINLLAQKESFPKSLGLRLLIGLRNEQFATQQRIAEIDSITSSQIQIKDAKLRGADLREAKLAAAVLPKADLIGANLRGADLRGADLVVANLGDADLRGTNLGGADLRSTDLGGADSGNTDLQGATYSQKTKFPSGFSVEGHNMRMVG